MRRLDSCKWYFQDRPAMQERMHENSLSYLFPRELCPSDTSAQEYYLKQQSKGFRLKPINKAYFRKMPEEIQRREIHLVWINMALNNAVWQPFDMYFSDFQKWLLLQLPSGTTDWPLELCDGCDFKDFSHLKDNTAIECLGEIAKRFGLALP